MCRVHQHIVVEHLGPVTRITQNRIAQRNAQNELMLDELDAAFSAAERDEDCRVVILAGAGDHFSAGHDIKASQASFTGILDAFESAVGSPPSFFHLNDSEGHLGSNRDRHMLIGEGQIGVEPFRWLMHDRRSAGVPLILETPQENYEIAENDDSPDPYDVRMVELLRSLEK